MFLSLLDLCRRHFFHEQYTFLFGMGHLNSSNNKKMRSRYWHRLHPCHPSNLNLLASFWFVFTVSGVFYCGLVIVLPRLYETSNEWVLFCHRVVCCFMFVEMMVNWFCIKLIDSTYIAELHTGANVKNMEIGNGNRANGPEQTYNVPDTEINISVPSNGIDRNRIVSSNNSPSKRKGTLFLVKIPDVEDGTENESPVTDKRQLIYPYWSWKPCLICNTQRPPRTHHCPICQKCVLKRDHHCFFTGTCIGLNNQRHFVVFTFWASLGTLYSLVQSCVYLFAEFLPKNTFWDLFYPAALVRSFMGHVTFMDSTMILLMYSLIFFCITSMVFFGEQMRNIIKGMTEFEAENNIKVVSTQTASEHLYGVFGKKWSYNFLFPLHFWYGIPEDGVAWPHVKA